MCFFVSCPSDFLTVIVISCFLFGVSFLLRKFFGANMFLIFSVLENILFLVLLVFVPFFFLGSALQMFGYFSLFVWPIVNASLIFFSVKNRGMKK